MNCPYDGAAAELVTGERVYPHRPDLAAKSFYLCPACGAYVGCHPGTTRALGRLANADLRAAKSRVHAAFEPLWKTGLFRSRRNAYAWRAREMGIDPDECHVGMFDEERCKKALEVIASRKPGMIS